MRWMILGIAITVLISPATARAECTLVSNGETRPTGTIIHNVDHNVLQACTNDGTWQALGPIPDPCDGSPSPGTRCDDGTIYAGTTVGGAPMYAAPCDHGMTWNGSSCTGSRIWRIWKTSNTITPGAFSSTDGVANTNAMEAAGLSDHPAAEACRTMGPQWYLPARGELSTIWSNLVNGAPDADGNEITDDFTFNIMSGLDGWYYSSSDGGATAGRAWFVVFSSGWNGDQSPNGVKSSSLPLRCVRRGIT